MAELKPSHSLRIEGFIYYFTIICHPEAIAKGSQKVVKEILRHCVPQNDVLFVILSDSEGSQTRDSSSLHSFRMTWVKILRHFVPQNDILFVILSDSKGSQTRDSSSLHSSE